MAIKAPKLGRLTPFSTIGAKEKINLLQSLHRPLSGYLGGRHTGGYWIERLKAEWCEAFGCQYAIPCNSATSGLLAACMAAGVGCASTVLAPAYTMSATASCAKVRQAKVVFLDIECDSFTAEEVSLRQLAGAKAVILTNLFGHPAHVHDMALACKAFGAFVIEDNAQAPFAMENGKYTGTIGHMGVFSLNVHKHIQCGEGGVVVTDDEYIAANLEGVINHGEIRDGQPGLNLRMTETTAAIACAQLKKAPKIIQSRIDIAHELTDMVKGVDWIVPPVEAPGCRHVYYIWAARVLNGKRQKLVDFLYAHEFPMKAGYTTPLPLVFGASDPCPEADRMEYKQLITFEVCAYDLLSSDLAKMRRIMQAAIEEIGS